MGVREWFNKTAAPQEPVAQNTQAQKPSNAKELYTQRAGQETTNRKPMDQMPPDQQVKVEAIKEKLEKATRHIQQKDTARPQEPADSTTSPQPMRQNMMSQDKGAPALSPTSAQAGATAPEKNTATPSQESPAKAPEKSAPRAPQTMARRPPSWER
jgi:hypothetical protein